MKTIRLLHFARIADRRGTSEETVETMAATAADLYAELEMDCPLGELRVAVNHAFADADAPIHDGDIVAFLAPFAGG